MWNGDIKIPHMWNGDTQYFCKPVPGIKWSILKRLGQVTLIHINIQEQNIVASCLKKAPLLFGFYLNKCTI